MKKVVSVFAIIILLAGCSNSTSWYPGVVNGEISNDTLNISNRSSQTIWYMAVERETIRMINWVRTKSEENKIESGETKQIPLSEVFGYEDGDEIIIHYWTSIDRNSELQSVLVTTD